MGSGLPFTIVKACGLGDKAGGKHKLVVGHDDKGFSLAVDHMVSREDVARVLAASATSKVARGLRFDLCSSLLGRPTTDIQEVFAEAEYPWQHPDQNVFDLIIMSFGVFDAVSSFHSTCGAKKNRRLPDLLALEKILQK